MDEKYRVEDVCDIFAEALTETVYKFTGMSLEEASRAQDRGFSGAMGWMYLRSDRSAAVFISAGEDDLRHICSYMTGLPARDITAADTLDALCELVNITCGAARMRLTQTPLAFTTSPPLVVDGKDMSLVIKDSTGLAARILQAGHVSVKLKLVMSQKDG